jgi:hypothetical protein
MTTKTQFRMASESNQQLVSHLGTSHTKGFHEPGLSTLYSKNSNVDIMDNKSLFDDEPSSVPFKNDKDSSSFTNDQAVPNE